MSRRRLGVWGVVGMLGLTGCAGKPVDSFTLEVDLPPEFRFIGGANYGPATGEICTFLAVEGSDRSGRFLLRATNLWPNA